MRRAALLSFLLAGAACWSPRAFAPREHVGAVAPDGSLAASYGVPDGDDDPATTAELRVWSSGARACFTDDDREVVELRVGFELENNGRETLQLDLGSVGCEDLRVDGQQLPPLLPLRIAGNGTAPPGTTARVEFVFEPAASKPSRIDGFAVRFVVVRGDRDLLHQVTPFGPHVWVHAHPYGPGWGPYPGVVWVGGPVGGP